MGCKHTYWANRKHIRRIFLCSADLPLPYFMSITYTHKHWNNSRNNRMVI